MAKRFVRNADSKRYYDWLDRAGEDLISARLLVQDDNCYNSAAFHCQQTIEKALKAYILFKSSQLVDGHNLTWLCKRAMRYDKKFRDWLAPSASLNRCYIETRYPADLPVELDYPKIISYYRMAKDMYLFICHEADEALASDDAQPTQEIGDFL